MSAVAPPPPPPSAPTPAPQPAGPGPAPGQQPAQGRRQAPPRAMVVRLVACVALALFGAQTWGDTVRPEADGRVLGAALAGGVLGLVVLGTAGLRRSIRAVALAGVTLAGFVGALLLAGVPAAFFDPRDWDALASGLADGISALPGLSVPYRGVDEWNRIAVLLGGTALAIAGPVLACWPRRPGRGGAAARTRFGGPVVAAVMLTVLYAVPAIQLGAERPYLDGTIFAVLLGAVLLGERLAPRDAPVAVPALVVAALVGLALAPRLDSPDPWVDYESIAQSLGERGTSAFSWDHGYGPLDWPRDGREVLRIRSDRSSYWKATTLSDFDGVRWREIRPKGLNDDPASDTPDPRWVRTIRVSVRNLRTSQFVAAGTTMRIARSPRGVVKGAPGSYVVRDRQLRRGHAYLARVYEPRPRAAQLAAAGSAYPSDIWPYLSAQVPASIGGPAPVDQAGRPAPGGASAYVLFPTWGDGREPLGFQGDVTGQRVGGQWIEDSRLGRTYRLAQRLLRQSSTPYDYIRRVQAYLQDGFTYTEQPPPSRLPLDAFLFRDKAGYCQQFSGAMALLLRMGGVPARIASGFSPGTFDGTRREYVVRDLDAHSWVEAYFPGYGWMTFDPTPAVAPARAQASGIEASETAAEDEDDEEESPAAASERGSDAASIDSGAAAEEDDQAPTALLIGAGLLVAAALAAALGAVLLHRRHARMTVEDRVRDLDRALRRSGRVHRDELTLQQLEERMRGAPEAAGYVRALRQARYGFADQLPSPSARAAVRRQLGAGLGWRGRLRALWALPPW